VIVGGLVLAAGEGRRFGGTKQLATVRGRPLLEHALAAVAELDPRVVVLGHEADAIRGAVDLQGARPVICEDWREGQAASLRRGVAALGDVDAAVILLGDMPDVTAEAVRRVVGTARQHEDAVAVRGHYDGIAGHPVLLRRPLLDRVGELHGDVGFRSLLECARIVEVELAGVANPRDIDTREELATR
jgi:CTP:molybdopterin cytidylyltransferase MocA